MTYLRRDCDTGLAVRLNDGTRPQSAFKGCGSSRLTPSRERLRYALPIEWLHHKSDRANFRGLFRRAVRLSAAAEPPARVRTRPMTSICTNGYSCVDRLILHPKDQSQTMPVYAARSKVFSEQRVDALILLDRYPRPPVEHGPPAVIHWSSAAFRDPSDICLNASHRDGLHAICAFGRGFR